MIKFDNYQDFLEHIYFYCFEETEKILIELKSNNLLQFSDVRSEYFFKHLGRKISGIQDQSYNINTLMVACATLLYDTGKVKDGGISGVKVKQVLGPIAFDFFYSIITKSIHGDIKKRPITPLTKNELIRLVSLISPKKLNQSIEKYSVNPKIELLKLLKKEFGEVKAEGIVAIQHLFGSTVTLLKEIENSNLDTSSIFVLGKPYSTNYPAMWYLRNTLGYFVHKGSSEYLGIEEYHKEADSNIEELLDKAIKKYLSSNYSKRSIILLDDGGRAIKKLHQEPFVKFAHLFVGVEQTRKGIAELKDIKLKIPVINVAQSWAKLNFESPIIAESVKEELLKRLKQMSLSGIVTGKNCLIAGYGSIGKAIAKALKSLDFKIFIYDQIVTARKQATFDGYETINSFDSNLNRMDIIIGCTGNTILDNNNFDQLKDGTVLISASSSDIEFSAWKLRSISTRLGNKQKFKDKFNLYYYRDKNKSLLLGDLTHPCHSLFVVPFKDKRVFLVNGGFPINFNGSIDPIPPAKISITRALLLLGCIQASNTKESGIHDLNDGMQIRLMELLNK